MNYSEALAYLYSMSDYERGGRFTRNPAENIAREAWLLEHLGNPQQDYSCTLIAGTKGKGSTASLIERVLREAGLRTGLYTQPDLHTFRERIRVSGRLISEQEMAALLTELRGIAEALHEQHRYTPFITYELSTALALLYFSRQHVQHAVLEVGLGGRLDATNITHPLVSVITSISYDHMEVLGNTLTQIATEKAGIIKPNGLVVTSAQSPEALLAIAATCQRQEARMIRIGPAAGDPAQAEVAADQLPPITYSYRLEARYEEQQRFTVWGPDHVYSALQIPLAGQHQLENATVALATLEALQKQGIAWNEATLRAGFQAVKWSARLEVIGRQPTIVVDGAHNADSIQKLLVALRATFSYSRLIMVLSVSRDKDLVGIITSLNAIDAVVLTHMVSVRAATIEELAELFREHAPHVAVHRAETSSQAMELATTLASENDLICATGSLYLASEVLRWSAAHGNAEVAAAIESVDH